MIALFSCLVNNADKFILNFSTASYELGTYFYNGLLKVKKDREQYPLFEAGITIEDVNLIQERKITDDTVVFKTLSPFLVRDYKDKNKYLTPSDEGFVSQLNQIVSDSSKLFLNRFSEIEFTNIKTSYKPPILHYGAPVDGIKGLFALKGDPKVLNLIYRIGLGSRRSQGFGMLEVLR
jgi:CRISPR-associated endoribonuclease Cas6